MPRVIEVNGYDVRVYTRDEQGHPPHVHVETADTVHKIMLLDDGVEYHSFKGKKPNRKEMGEAAQIVADHLDPCKAVWRQYNEPDET